MRFYDPSTSPPERVDSADIFPRVDDTIAAQRCLKMGLLPSVTTVLDVVREEYLERWFMREAIDIVASGKSKKDAVDEVFSRSSPNAQFGTDCHSVAENTLKTLSAPVVEDPEVARYSAPLVSWILTHVRQCIFAEELLASEELGVAGTADMVFETHDGRLVLGDLKVVKFSWKFPPKPGLAYKMQLSAYAEMLREKTRFSYDRLSFYLASPFGNDKEPELRIFPHSMDYLPAFKATRTMWEAKVMQEQPKPLNGTPRAAWTPTRK